MRDRNHGYTLITIPSGVRSAHIDALKTKLHQPVLLDDSQTRLLLGGFFRRFEVVKILKSFPFARREVDTLKCSYTKTANGFLPTH